MKNAQELSLNMIVVGALALLVLLIIGGVMVFGGQGLLGSLTSAGPSASEISSSQLQTACSSKCNILRTRLQTNASFPRVGNNPDVKNFCCYGVDLNSDGTFAYSERCANNFACSYGTVSNVCANPPAPTSYQSSNCGSLTVSTTFP